MFSITGSSEHPASVRRARERRPVEIMGMRNRAARKITSPRKRARKIRMAPELPAAAPATMTVPAAMPADFGRRGLRAFLDRSDGGGICQRQRLGLLGRSGEDQYRANCSEAENSRHLHG